MAGQRLLPASLTLADSAFPHLIRDGFLPPDWAEACAAALPAATDAGWHLYASPLEQKRSMRCDGRRFEPPLAELIATLTSPGFIAELSDLTRLTLAPVALAELHATEPGGFLLIHCDANLHPHSALEKRLTALLYLSPGWRPAYGGQLEFWSEDMEHCLHRLQTPFNRLVLFAAGEKAFHGHPAALTAPAGYCRYALGVSYYGPAPPTLPPHKARFVARPWERGDGLDPLRLQRALP